VEASPGGAWIPNDIRCICSGGASAVKEPGHFEVRNPPARSPGLFSSKTLTTFFSCRPQNTDRQRRFTVKIKQIKRSDMVTFLLSVHTITEAKQYAGIGRAEPGLEPGRWIFQRPGVAPPLCICTKRVLLVREILVHVREITITKWPVIPHLYTRND